MEWGRDQSVINLLRTWCQVWHRSQWLQWHRPCLMQQWPMLVCLYQLHSLVLVASVRKEPQQQVTQLLWQTCIHVIYTAKSTTTKKLCYCKQIIRSFVRSFVLCGLDIARSRCLQRSQLIAYTVEPFFLLGIISLFIMCVGIIRNNSLVGRRARAESNPGHWAHHALLHMAAKCVNHSTTEAGCKSHISDNITMERAAMRNCTLTGCESQITLNITRGHW